MLITKTSTLTGKHNSMDLPVTKEQLFHWQSGNLVQDVFPNLDKDQREFLISGITPEEWQEAF